ncbi:Gfo/Idh/MocA family protein [Paenibacillus eucommiae]|uniref:Dehydrogenase n=1 Tax=Paenibacillus eucommiae TaxID=1355755 RepID=A0ABS4IWB3_9BACL|nr:Gfo/Idh/MocA family oxidoreductase [Paenibacillus eucommiae]MBP1991864.1 putative dehydrogenase [Paenibacillus eucommiae]
MSGAIDHKRKVGIGILGTGSRGVYFGGHYFSKHPDCELVGLCDVRQESLEFARSQLGDIPATTSIDEFWQYPNMDAVVICSNDHAHAENAIAALAAGKHVYLEKPMAQTIEDCDRIIEAAAQSGCVVMVGLELRYCSLMVDMKRIIASGEIGEIKIGTVTDNVSVGGQYYYHGARRRKDYVKSLILEKGTHSLDLTNWLLDASPVKVYCSGGLNVFGGSAPNDKRCRDCSDSDTCEYYVDNVTGYRMDYGDVRLNNDLCVYAEECDVHDNALVLIDYDNGSRISYMECHFTPEYTREFMFVGTKGKIWGFYNNEQDFKIRVLKRHTEEELIYFPEKKSGGHGGGDTGIVNEFVDLVKRGEPIFKGIKGARDSAAIAIAANESSETGLPVSIQQNKKAGNINS